MGVLQTDEIFDQALLEVHVVLSGDTENVMPGSQKTKMQSLSPLSLGALCTTLATQKT